MRASRSPGPNITATPPMTLSSYPARSSGSPIVDNQRRPSIVMSALCPPRQRLLDSLRGQHLHIPDLRVLFEHWPQAVSPYLDQLKLDVPERLLECEPLPKRLRRIPVWLTRTYRLTSSSKKLAKLNKAEFGLFSATWWPTASLEHGKILTCLCMWVSAPLKRTMWKGAALTRASSSFGMMVRLGTSLRNFRPNILTPTEIDAEVGRLAGDLKAAGKFRDDTLRFMRYSLGLSQSTCPTPDNRIIAFFRVIGDAARESYTLGRPIYAMFDVISTHSDRTTRAPAEGTGVFYGNLRD
jgi:hypothetical protein